MGTKVNEKFFSSLSLASSYWAGFIAADGCVRYTEKGYPTLSIGLQASDLPHLERFKSDCGAYNTNIGVYTINYLKQDGTYAKVARMQLSGVYSIVQDLFTIYNITPRKSFSLLPPNITTKENILAYIAGLIDGDGTIRVANVNAKSNSNTLRIELCGASEALLSWVASQMDFYYPLSSSLASIEKSKVKGDQVKKTYSLTGSRASLLTLDVKKLQLPLLQRKWEKAFTFIDTHYSDTVCDNRISVSDEMVSCIRKDVSNGMTRKEVSVKYALSRGYINRVVAGSRRGYIEKDLAIPPGKKNPKQMSDETALQIKKHLSEGFRNCQIVKMLNVTVSQVARIKRGTSFKHLN